MLSADARANRRSEAGNRWQKGPRGAHVWHCSAAARASGSERMCICKMLRRPGLDKATEQGRAPTAPGDEDEESYRDPGV